MLLYDVKGSEKMFFKENPFVKQEKAESPFIMASEYGASSKENNLFVRIVSDYDEPVDFYINNEKILDNFSQEEISQRFLIKSESIFKIYHHTTKKLLLKGTIKKSSFSNIIAVISHQLYKVYLAIYENGISPILSKDSVLSVFNVNGDSQKKYTLWIYDKEHNTKRLFDVLPSKKTIISHRIPIEEGELLLYEDTKSEPICCVNYSADLHPYTYLFFFFDKDKCIVKRIEDGDL